MRGTNAARVCFHATCDGVYLRPKSQQISFTCVGCAHLESELQQLLPRDGSSPASTLSLASMMNLPAVAQFAGDVSCDVHEAAALLNYATLVERATAGGARAIVRCRCCCTHAPHIVGIVRDSSHSVRAPPTVIDLAASLHARLGGAKYAYLRQRLPLALPSAGAVRRRTGGATSASIHTGERAASTAPAVVNARCGQRRFCCHSRRTSSWCLRRCRGTSTALL